LLASSDETIFLSDEDIAHLADHYNHNFPSTRYSHDTNPEPGMERYIRYATYDLSVLYIAMDVHAAMTTRQSITGFLIVNSEYTGHPGSHWVSIVYTITPREKEITQGSSQVTPLSMMTPVTNHERTNATFSELASNSSSSSSSFANGPVSDLSSNFINYLSLL
jgi:hypothetical protein